jgi:hypothetical protein
VTNWPQLNSVELVALNGVLTKSGLRPLSAASRALVAPVCSEGATARP